MADDVAVELAVDDTVVDSDEVNELDAVELTLDEAVVVTVVVIDVVAVDVAVEFSVDLLQPTKEPSRWPVIPALMASTVATQSCNPAVRKPSIVHDTDASLGPLSASPHRA